MKPVAHHRRGSVLLAVAIAMAMAALLVSAWLGRAVSTRGGAQAGVRQTQLQLLAASGARGAMAEIAAQREHLLHGGAPTLTTEWELFREHGYRGVVRLVDTGSGTAASESAKLDVNVQPPEVLGKVAGVGIEGAKRLVAARKPVIGTNQEIATVLGAVSPAPATASAGDQDSKTDGKDCLTVYSFGSVEMSLPDAAAGWSRELKLALAEHLEQPVVDALEKAMAKEKPATPARLVSMLRSSGAPVTAWGPVLASVRFGKDGNRGQVDVSRAEEGVLAALAGFDESSAKRAVEARERLGPDSLKDLGWLVTAGALDGAGFEKAVNSLTVAGLVWRVRVEASLEKAREEPSEAGGEGGVPAGGASMGPRPTDSVGCLMVWDVVIDASAEPARLAYVRDVTYEGLTPPTVGAASSEKTRGSDWSGVPGKTDEMETRGRGAANNGAAAGPAKPAAAGGETTSPRGSGRIGRWTGRSGGT